MDAAMGEEGPGKAEDPGGGGLAIALVLAATLLVRVVGVDQPIVENYVGRQVPTAMVARNLERGSGLLRPPLDTAPSPITSWSSLRCMSAGSWPCGRATGLGLEASGRILSVIATAVAGWGLFELMRRRAGRRGDPGRRGRSPPSR